VNVTFIIPCYNAEKIIIDNHNKLSSFLKKNKIKKKIIYINDGSEDKTLEELKKINKKDIKILNNKKNSGKSFSIIKALKLVKKGNVVLIDCDLPYFNYLKIVINKLNKCDLVIVNRKIKKSFNTEKNLNFYKLFRNFVSNILGNIIEKKLKLNVSGDTQAGLKAFKIFKKIRKENFLSKYYFFDIELINFFRKNKLKIKLIPVKFNISKKSTIKILSLKNFKIIYEFYKILKKSSN
tara:strand:+ start:195 stop:905 length:711 start_codon:yes stop_codon:yes gene_type:complete